nr:small hydrophobic protein [Grapevine leafroll-associated virus 4]
MIQVQVLSQEVNAPMLDLFSQFNWVFQLCAFALVLLFFAVLALVLQKVFLSTVRGPRPSS